MRLCVRDKEKCISVPLLIYCVTLAKLPNICVSPFPRCQNKDTSLCLPCTPLGPRCDCTVILIKVKQKTSGRGCCHSYQPSRNRKPQTIDARNMISTAFWYHYNKRTLRFPSALKFYDIGLHSRFIFLITVDAGRLYDSVSSAHSH